MTRHSRRMFLRGAATALAIPFLESALPRSARADGTAPGRLLFWFVPNGIPLGRWTPTKVGREWYTSGLPYTLSPLGALAEQVTVISGLENDPPGASIGGGDHARGTGSFLTCSPIQASPTLEIRNGVSIDQLAAQVIAGETPFPSLQLGTEPSGTTGDCSGGFSCAYQRNLAWAGPTQPLPNIIDPTVAFGLLFPQGLVGLTPEEIARRNALGTSVLDHVLAESTRMSARLGSTDRAKLDQYLTAVRDVEFRMQGLGTGGCVRPNAEVATGIDDTVRILTDLQVLALQCDLTRVVTFMMANGQSNRSYSFLGVPGSHHEISHHQGDPVKIEQLEVIANWEVAKLTYLLQSMDNILDTDDRSLLENSLVYFGSEVQDGDTHSHFNLPVLLAGGLGGKIVTGEHVVYQDKSMSNLFLSVLQAFGSPVESFGYSTGTLSSVLV